MKNHMEFLAPVLLAVLIGSLTFIFAQSERGSVGKIPGGEKRSGGMPPPPLSGGQLMNGLLPELEEALNLTDNQKEQIKILHEKARSDSRSYFEKAKDADEKLRSIVDSGNFNEAQAREIISAKTQALTEAEIIHLRTVAAVNNVLTAEQRAKFAEIKANRPEPPQGGGPGMPRDGRPGMPPPPPPQN